MLQNFVIKVQNSSLYTVAQLILQTYTVMLVGLAVGIFSARSLSVSDRGSLSLLLLVCQIFSRLCSLGFEQIVLKNGFLKYGPADLYVASAVGVLAGTPIIIISLIFLKLPSLFFLPTVMAVFLISLLRVNISSIIHNKDIKFLTIFNIGQSFLQLIFYAAVFNVHRFEYFYSVWLFNIGLASIVSLYITKRNEQLLYKGNILNIWREGTSFIGVVIPEIVFTFCLELPFIRQALGGLQTGLYSISNTITGIYFQTYYAVSAILIKNKGKIIMQTPIYIILFLFGVAIWLLAKPVISNLFGEKYIDASLYLAWMLPVTALLGTIRIIQVSADRQPSSKTQLGIALILIGSIFLTPLVKFNGLVVPYIAACYAINSVLTFIAIKRVNS